MAENGLELFRYVDLLDRLSKRFVTSPGLGMYLKAEDSALFKQSVLEVTSLIDSLLGAQNSYSVNIFNTVNSGSGGLSGGPSLVCVLDTKAVIQAAQTEIDRRRATSGSLDVEPSEPYVSQDRINELRNVASDGFDLTRLIRLCEELNSAHAKKSYMTIAMILRTIIDHIPPIFAVKSFSEVANNYRGAQSFKEAMGNLNTSLRKVADSHLHVQIRRKEVLPEFQQVDFRSPLDLLLSEIIRLLK